MTIQEREILEDIKNHVSNDPDWFDADYIAAKQNPWPYLVHLSAYRANLIAFLPFFSNQSILLLGAGSGTLARFLAEKVQTVTCVEMKEELRKIGEYRTKRFTNIYWGDSGTGLYQRILWMNLDDNWKSYFPHANSITECFVSLRERLCIDGELYVSCDNPFSLRNFNGLSSESESSVFSAIEGRANTNGYARQLLKHAARLSGFMDYRFYYPYPDQMLPQSIFTDAYMPSETQLRGDWCEQIANHPGLFNRAYAYRHVIKQNSFGTLANSFLLQLSLKPPIENIVHVTFSNQRAVNYSIFTKITTSREDTIGNRLVTKIAFCSDANKHIAGIAEYDRSLDMHFKGTDFHVTPASYDRENNSVTTRFVEGINLEEVLEEAYEKRDYDTIYAWLDQFYENLCKAFGKCHYGEWLAEHRDNSGFEAVFGAVEIAEEELGDSYIDIDLTFQNIIIERDIWHVIDYEWTFPFFIPMQFVMYRAITILMMNTGGQADGFFVNVFDRFQVSEEMKQRYQRMEEAFVRYVYLADGNKECRLSVILDRLSRKQSDYFSFCWSLYPQGLFRIQSYVRFGEEELSYYPLVDDIRVDQEGRFHVHAHIPEGVQEFRLNLGETNCLVQIDEIKTEKGESIFYQTWVKEIKKGLFLCDIGVMQLVFPQIKEVREISVDYRIQSLPGDFATQLLEILQQEEEKLHFQEERITELENLVMSGPSDENEEQSNEKSRFRGFLGRYKR